MKVFWRACTFTVIALVAFGSAYFLVSEDEDRAVEVSLAPPEPINPVVFTPFSDEPTAVGRARLAEDLRAMADVRPGYPFWQHVFKLPDGHVAYGSSQDGRLLAVFPTGGDWPGDAQWYDSSLPPLLAGANLHPRLSIRRDQVSDRLEIRAGPVIHNMTRGDFLAPNVERYGAFVGEWGRIFERFGVPAEVGLAQAIVESGLNGRVRSEADALGLCQWLRGNWERIRSLHPHEVEAFNQTTQAPFCAAYLTILATKYHSFIPALSEHHAGGTNVGRVLINGVRLGAEDSRTQYLVGSHFARELRQLPGRGYQAVVRSYGPRSYLYSEMVFGNIYTAGEIVRDVSQARVYAMRANRDLPLGELARVTNLSEREIKRFNPALVNQVPEGATVYLPRHLEGLGEDVAFWRHPPADAFVSVLDDFLKLDLSLGQWYGSSGRRTIELYRTRFLDTDTEEGQAMATMLAYVAQEMFSGARSEILARYERDPDVIRLVSEGLWALGGHPSVLRVNAP